MRVKRLLAITQETMGSKWFPWDLIYHSDEIGKNIGILLSGNLTKM